MGNELIRNIKSAMKRLIGYAKWSECRQDGYRNVIRVETTNTVEYMQDWGFYSFPPEGGDAVVVRPVGSSAFAVAVKVDGPFRPKAEKGEAGLFNAEGVIIRLRGKSVIVEGADTIELGEGKALVTEDILTLLRDHVHDGPVSASLATVTTMKTTKVKGE